MTKATDDDSTIRETGSRPAAHVDDATQPSAAMLVRAARWWADFADRVERAVSERNGSGAAPVPVTFTRQSPREISIAHRWASTELRLDGIRIRINTRRAEPVRHNMGATTLVTFREGVDGLVALADEHPVSLDHIVDHVVGLIVRHQPTR